MQGKSGGKSSQKTPENKYVKPQGPDEGSKVGGGGSAHGKCRCRSLRVRGWRMTMDSDGVEISIAGGVEEIVCAPNPMLFLFFLFFFLFFFLHFFLSCVHCY